MTLEQHTPSFLESLRTSSAVALSHILRLNQPLFGEVLERIGITQFCSTLVNGTPKV